MNSLLIIIWEEWKSGHPDFKKIQTPKKQVGIYQN
jgi:hypothetical protein